MPAKESQFGDTEVGFFPWSPNWDSLAGTEQGLLGGRDDGICRQSENWVLFMGTEMMTGKLIET